MGWTNFTYKCGHEGRRQFIGRVKDQQRRADWYGENHICDECLAKERAAESAKGAEQAKAEGLPALTGSAKQIAWAEALRAKALPRIDAFPRAFAALMAETKDLSDTQRAALADAALAAVATARLQSAAREWIDGRDLGVMLMQMVRSMGPALDRECGMKQIHEWDLVAGWVLDEYRRLGLV